MMRAMRSIPTAMAGMLLLPGVLPWASLQAQDTQGAPSLSVNKSNRTVAITATERVTHVADVGVVHIGFVRYGATREAAYAAGSGVSNAIVEALIRAGVGKGSIQSDAQELSETAFFGNPLPSAQERQSRAFTLRQSWTVRTAADEAARVLDIAVKAGGDQSGQIDWQLSDPNAAQAAAAAKAIQRAQAQARAMADGLGVHLGDLLYASNQVEGAPVRPQPVLLKEMRTANAPMPAPLAINPREIETSATVYAVFVLE